MESNDIKIAVLQNQMNNVEKKVDDGFKDNKNEMDNLNRKMDAFIATAEDKFASKWVEDGLKWAISLILGAVILALIALVVKS